MTALITLRLGLTLEAEAAASWARMEAERGAPLDVNRSTVSRAAQQIVRDAYLAHLRGGPWAPLALDPDDSWHCLPRARAVDTDDDAWIRAHPDHGWRFVVKDEKWHAQYYPELDRHRGEGFPARPVKSTAPAPSPTIQEDTMIRIQAPGRGIALIGPGYYRHLVNDEEVQNSEALIAAHLSGNDRQFDLWVSMATGGTGPAVSALIDVEKLVEQIEAAGIATKVADELARRLTT